MTTSKGPRVKSMDVIVGQRVRFFRLLAGMSQTNLAHRIDTSFQQIQKYERGTNRISVGRLFLIAQALGASVEEFFDLEEVPERSKRRLTREFALTIAAIKKPGYRQALATIVAVILDMERAPAIEEAAEK